MVFLGIRLTKKRYCKFYKSHRLNDFIKQVNQGAGVKSENMSFWILLI